MTTPSGGRNNQRALSDYEQVDDLEYSYFNYGNRLSQVKDNNATLTYTAKDFKDRGTTEYGYDANGNMTSNVDKQISLIAYNHLNLPREITFTTGAKLKFAYDAVGNKLTQTVYDASGTLTKTQDYLGEIVLLDGALDYLIHEEGRIAVESGSLYYEYYVKDHLGNVRQVLRNPTPNARIATMEQANAEEEESQFTQIKSTRRNEPKHNITQGGQEVAWLNADRGEMVGPGTSQEIFEGDSVVLSVHGKYLDRKKTKVNIASFATTGGKTALLDQLNELALNTSRAGGANPIAVLNLVDILAKDLQKKEVPEAYLIYALYDQDSNRYEVGKKVLTRNAANQHEELEEKLAIKKNGYIETFVVNETDQDVWFDNMRVMSVSSVIVQETHYDPWGLELTGLGYQYGGIKANKYLYNGKELIEDNGLQYYDYGARMYDPAIGRWVVVDPMSDSYQAFSPYNYTLNSPIKFTDPNGMWVESATGFSTDNQDEIQAFFSTQKQDDKKEKTYDGGTLDGVTVTASRINDGGNSGNNYSLGDYGAGLSLAGEGMWLLGENRSTRLYQQGFRRGLSGNYQLTGRNLSLFGNQPMTSATKPLTGLSTISNIGKGLSNFGTGLAVAGTLVDTYQYSQGDLSGPRFSYHLAGTGTSLGALSLLGGPYGAGVGAIFFLGEKAWDMGQPMRNEISSQYWQFMNDFDNALRSGWRPR